MLHINVHTVCKRIFSQTSIATFTSLSIKICHFSFRNNYFKETFCTISNEVSSWRDSLKFKTFAKIYYGAFKVLNLNEGVDL